MLQNLFESHGASKSAKSTCEFLCAGPPVTSPSFPKGLVAKGGLGVPKMGVPPEKSSIYRLGNSLGIKNGGSPISGFPPRNDTFETRDPLNWGAILLQRIGTMVVALISNVSRNHWDCISTYCRWAVGLASSCVFFGIIHDLLNYKSIS